MTATISRQLNWVMLLAAATRRPPLEKISWGRKDSWTHGSE